MNAAEDTVRWAKREDAGTSDAPQIWLTVLPSLQHLLRDEARRHREQQHPVVYGSLPWNRQRLAKGLKN